uniref:Protein kinase domain-containing protein n=1 Tax=Schistosoma mansoni TaxID=6183 RepID=A0A3Q0KS08_SCHMA
MMIIWNYYNYTLFNFIFILFIIIHKSNHEKCFCYLNSTTNLPYHTTNNTNVKQLIHCSLTQLSYNHSEELSCQRVDKFICIGPYLSNDSHINLSINPWAFSNLFVSNSVNTLQLDFNINTHQLNALTLAGMDGLLNLLARTSLLSWDSCSFIGLPNLHEITLNCKAVFPEFLTFGSFITLIRFVDCEGVPLQFYCIQCIQNPNVYVIRIRPGPPLRQYLVKFTRLSSSSGSSTSSLNNKIIENNENLSPNHHLPLDSCVYGVCSDEMLCRDNLPLKQVQAGIGQPEKPIIEIVSNDEILIPNTTSMDLYDSMQLTSIQPILNTTPSIIEPINTTSVYDIVILTKYGHSKTDHRQKIWIVSAIIILIILFIITLGILIVINYQRKSKHRLKSRSNKSMHNHNNGTHHKSNGRTTQHDSLIITEDGNRIELPDIVSCK